MQKAGDHANLQLEEEQQSAAVSAASSYDSKATEEEVAASRIEGSALAFDDADSGDTTAPGPAEDNSLHGWSMRSPRMRHSKQACMSCMLRRRAAA